jgi:D-glycero-D-manno-heptose 1,7-bisphosphate phosphatase
MRRAIFLDRDGVINRAIVRGGKPYPPANLTELEILPGVAEACQRLRDAGFLLVVVTNQPDVARGSQSREVVEAINNALQAALPLDDLRVCYHDDKDECQCRKPAPGLLQSAASDWQIDLSASFMIGDRWKDIAAGREAGCCTVLIEADYAEPLLSQPDWRASSLLAAAHQILNIQQDNQEDN